MEKQNLTIKISVDTYHQLRSDIGRGRISEFIESLVNRELGGTEKKIEQEYREFYSDPRNLKEAKQWEKAEIES
jgi:predicted CopG family antitoxin